MAVPTGKVSKSRRDKRRANWKLNPPALATCPHCGEYKLSHRVCKNCGYYNDRKVLNVEA
ncbi:MAG: 50S ribosomal protein L32 [Clostridia bacterium]|nr:50S ribosomal protein L32 [Clostridia bacterium]